jgi:Fe-S cluster assembly ATP-binding protein
VVKTDKEFLSMKADLLKIENLTVKLGTKVIIDGLNLRIKEGEIQAFLGPNASGKTTLAHTIMGLPLYKIAKGKIVFHGRNINNLSPEKRAKLGIGLVFQNPPAVKGITLNNLLEQIDSRPVKAQDSFKDKSLASLGSRELNLGFSGGEKKISELYQLIYLNPKLVILDEIDSGLDIEKLNQVVKFLKGKFWNKNRAFIVITHRGEILRYLKPDLTHIMLAGKIVCSSKDWKNIWQTIKKYGYEKCKICDKKTIGH